MGKSIGLARTGIAASTLPNRVESTGDGLRGSVDGSIPWIAVKSPATAQRFIHHTNNAADALRRCDVFDKLKSEADFEPA